MQSQMERERQRLAIEERKAEEHRRLLEEQEKEKLRNEKRAAKERRREARVKEDLKKQQDRLKMSSSMSAGPFNGQGFSNGSGNSSHNFNEYQANKGSYIDIFDISRINYFIVVQSNICHSKYLSLSCSTYHHRGRLQRIQEQRW